MSAAAIRPSPPARAGPPTRATTGFGHSQTRREHVAQHRRPARVAGSRTPRRSPSGRRRSRRPARCGVSTTTRTASSATAAASAAEQLGHQRRGQRVAVVRAVQGERGDAARRPAAAVSGPWSTMPERYRHGRPRAGTLDRCPAPCPTASPSPPTARCPPPPSRGVGARGFGVYVHVPFCASRCGYCDFNTYTAAELGGGVQPGRRTSTPCWPSSRWPRGCSTDAPPPRVDTVFVGGGTPTLLPPDDLARILDGIDAHLGAGRRRRGHHRGQPGVGRPRRRCARCARPGSPGSRSACSRPRRTCSRCWTAGTRRAARPQAAAEAREAGFDHVNLDLIYGTPGETRGRLRRARCDAAIGAGRRPRQRVLADRGGRHPAGRPDAARRAAVPDDDVAADRYLAAEAALGGGRLRLVRGVELGRRRRPPGAGTTCSTGPAATGGASGPGAHSHVGGVRWWNVKHPAGVRGAGWRRAPRPAHGREVLVGRRTGTWRT